MRCCSTVSAADPHSIHDRFVFQPFWHAFRDHDGSGKWEESFAVSDRLMAHGSVDASATAHGVSALGRTTAPICEQNR